MKRILTILIALVLSQFLLPAGNEGQLKGRILDEKGESLPGAVVRIVGTETGAMTDAEGRFSLAASAGVTIEISFIGYETVQMVLTDLSELTVRLDPQTTYIEEAVVVGYGEQKKIDLTGSVSQIKGTEIESIRATDVVSALQGKMPGVVVTQTCGQPGMEDSQITIRGWSSVNNLKALVLVDGMEADLDMVNPNDIASISVLKDAAAASIYGSKAAAGVILVTTRQGEAQKIRVNYDGSFSCTRSGRMPSRLNSWEEYAITQRASDKPLNLESMELMKNPNVVALLSSRTAINYLANTDWIAESLNDWGYMHRHSVAVNGGNKQIQFNASMGYYQRKGFLKYGPDKNDRLNFRLNLNAKSGNYVDYGFRMSWNLGTVDANAVGNNAMLGTIYRCRSIMPVYFPHDEETLACVDEYCGYGGSNPIDMMHNSGTSVTKTNDYNMLGTVRFRNFVKGLQFRVTASRSFRSQAVDKKSRRLIWHSRGENEYRYSQTQPSYIARTRISSATNKLQAQLNYDLKANRNNLHLMAGYEWEDYRYDNVYAYKAYMTGDNYSLNYGQASSAANSDLIRTASTMSVFARVNYDYNEKYLIEANFRADGSSRLSPENRWGFFPSVSAGWVLSKENFVRNNARWIDLLKIRASWGQLGNAAALGYYDYINIVDNDYKSIIIGNDTATSSYISTLASPYKTWETVEISNIGLDFGFFRGKLTGSFEYYFKSNKDMLASVNSIPSLIGVGLPSYNVGRLNTWGWDFNLKWSDTIGKYFNYWIGCNVADSQNILVSYTGTNMVSEGVTPLLEGYPLNTIWGYTTDGLFQETPQMQDALYQPGGALTAAGDVRYVNLDDDPYINGGEYTSDNPGDLVCLGTTDPRYIYTVDFGVNWRGLSFSVMLYGVGQRYFLIDSNTLNPTGGSLYQAFNIHRDYWTEDNTGAFMPRPVYKGGDYNYKPADRWIQDASYLRIKNITLAYDIPLKNTKIVKGINVNLSGENLWEFTKTWDCFDPEAPSLTSAENWYAFYRAVTLGVKLTF